MILLDLGNSILPVADGKGNHMADDELFFEEMAGVKPLKPEPRERLDKRPESANTEQRRLAASGVLDKTMNPLAY